MGIGRGASFYFNDLLPVHVVGGFDGFGETFELVSHFFGAVDVHGKDASHVDHDVGVLGEECLLSGDVAFQVRKTVDDFADGFFSSKISSDI